MMKSFFKRRKPTAEQEPPVLSFLDCITPSVLKFETDHYLCGNTYRCVWALREYPATTETQALLSRLGDRRGVTLHIYCRTVSPSEENRIIHNATNRNRLERTDTNDLRRVVTAESNLQDMAALLGTLDREHEPLVYCAVYIGLCADSYEALQLLKTSVEAELLRCKLTVDKLLLRQQEGFRAVQPAGFNALGMQFQRVLPASSVANLYPFSYSGKADPQGFYIGKDKFGSNIVVDFDRRDSDKTSANILILGNSGQGKSYLMKLLLCNLLESGKSVISLDAEHELEPLCSNLNGCFIDLMAGERHINVLEVKCWDTDTESNGVPIEAQRSGFDGERSRSGMSELSHLCGSEGYETCGDDAPNAFRKSTLLARHISFLRDFFRAYKDFSDAQLDTMEILLSKLYAQWGITEMTDLRKLTAMDYPILSDFYDLIENEYLNYNPDTHQLYTKELLQEVLLGLHSLCIGADAHFFNGHTDISSERFLVFGVGGILNAAKNLRNALLFNVLSYMSDKLLVEGNTVAALDELYLWLSNPVAIEYIRNCLKRVRKRDSALLMASQNLEDFDQEGVRELTKPLFAIPPHQFLFDPGTVRKQSFMEMLRLEDTEFELISRAQRGECLFRCGSERYMLQVHAPAYKETLFGTAGGR